MYLFCIFDLWSSALVVGCLLFLVLRVICFLKLVLLFAIFFNDVVVVDLCCCLIFSLFVRYLLNVISRSLFFRKHTDRHQ